MTPEEIAAQAAADLEAKRIADEAAAAAAKEEEDKKKAEDVKQFTQAQIDEMIQKAKGQVKKKYEDYDTLKDQLKAFEDAKNQKELDEMTELDRTKKLLQDKEDELARIGKEVKTASINAAFEKAAKEAGVPEKYVADARLLAGINDETDVATISETVKTLVESKPFLVEKQEKQQQSIGGASNVQQQKQEKSKEQLLEEAATKARKSGKVEDKIAYVALKRKLNG